MALTCSRMLVCPIFVILLWGSEPTWPWTSSILFMLASLTDWFDGHFARKFGVITNMGKFMDPIADKILVAAVLIMLVPSGRVGPVLVLLLLARDILIGGIRSVAAADNIVIDAKATGKLKTAMQMVGIPCILVYKPVFGVPLYETGLVLLWVSVVLSLISGYQYVQLYVEGRSDRRL
jgi:CDP-diacylglycerol--glycerol-3-phosphate 3-phosphatidyltransferase